MPTGPSYGGNAKVAFKKSTAWGTWVALGASIGHAIAIDSFEDQQARNPADVRETGLSVDYDTFVEGESQVGFSVTGAMRYGWIHQLILAGGLGKATMNTAAVPDNIAIELLDALPIVGWAHQFPVGPTNTLYENRWNSAVCNRLTLSHRQGDVMRYRADFVAYDRDYQGTPGSTWPSTANHVPTAAHTYINWSDVKLTGTDGMHIKCPGGSGSYIRVVPQSWQITLDNALIAPFAIGEGRRPFQPVRNGKREVRFTATMAYDDAMVEVLAQIHGTNEAAAGKAFHAKMHYQCPGTTNATADSLNFRVELSNMRTIRAPVQTTGPELQWTTIEARAQYLSGSGNVGPDPIKFIADLGGDPIGYDPVTQW